MSALLTGIFFGILVAIPGITLLAAWPEVTQRLIDRNDAFWAGRGGTFLRLAALVLIANAIPVTLLTLFSTYGAACASMYWTAEQIRWAGWLLPLFGVCRTLILVEYCGLAAVIGISWILRIGSIIHQKLRS